MTAPSTDQARFEELIEDVQSCKLCERMRNSSRILGRSSGDVSAKMMFIGEAPGRLGADDTAIPFHGDKSGENFEKLISQVGISRYDFFITNAVLCNPKDDKGNNSTPNRREVVNCSTFMRKQIEIVQPKIVVTLGNQALFALKDIEDHALELAQDVRNSTAWFGRILIPLYHPGQRAMMHRSFLNQLSDYRFVAEQFRKLVAPKRSRDSRAHTKEDAASLVTTILAISGPISYFRLHKLFYLIEYHHFRMKGKRLTSSYVIRQKDGPYFTDLHIGKLKRAIPRLIITEQNARLTLSIKDGVHLFESSGLESGEDLYFFVSDVLRRYGTKSDEQIKTAVYLTQPMRSILRKEKYAGANLFNAAIEFAAPG
jgi:uracil-DNA glycosylase family 4